MLNHTHEYKKLINSSRWRKLRASIINEHPICQECKVAFSREVHHIIEVTRGQTSKERHALCFDPENLKAVCHECHVLIHTALGKQTSEYYEQHAKASYDAVCKRFG